MTSSAKANQLANFPLNFLRTGYYNYSDGELYDRMANGVWWSATRSSDTNAYNINTHTSYIGSQIDNPRGDGFALREGVA